MEVVPLWRNVMSAVFDRIERPLEAMPMADGDSNTGIITQHASLNVDWQGSRERFVTRSLVDTSLQDGKQVGVSGRRRYELFA